MSDKEQKYQSRLHRAAGTPTRGMGAGYSANQRVIGSDDPEEAARLASMSPEAAQEEQDRATKLQRDADAMREDILIAVLNKQWSPDTSDWPSIPEDAAEWQELLKRQPLGMIQKWHEQSNKAIEDAIEAEDEMTIQESLGGITTLDPSDPLYDPMTDKEKRKRIEADLKPLDFEEMVFTGSTSQAVPLRENFVVTFRTITTQHGLWLEYMMSQEDETSYQHTRHLFSLMQLAACLEKVNERRLPGDITAYHKHEQRDEFVAVIKERMEFLGRMPGPLTDELIVQYVWFTGRVRKSLSGDLMRKVGNS
jgi:hypothetical protein